MKQFPPPVKPPPSVATARRVRHKEIVWSARIGIFVRLFIVVLEFLGVYLFGSAALLLDGLSTLVDVASSLALIACIKYASKPPDKNHPFGHGRLEPLIGLQIGLFLAVLGAYMLIQQAIQVNEPSDLAISPFLWLFPFIALILLEGCYRVIMRSAQKHDSPALATDALHYRIDSLTSLLAAIVLFFGAFFPELSHRLDHAGAFCIAGVMIFVGCSAAYRNIHQLLDRTPDKEYFILVEESAKSIDGVLGTEKIRIQQYGPDAHVDIDVEVDPHLSVEIAHKISQKVRAEIQRKWPAVRDVTVHIEPYYPGDH